MRSSFACAAGVAVAILAACSSFEDASSGSSGADSGTSDALDETHSNDASSEAEASGPPGMVLVQTAATSFWIDAREVTTGEFLSFKEKVVQANGDAGFPGVCNFKTGLGPAIGCPATATGAAVSCVDWCDAFAYCKFVGKRLCGRIGGGAPLTSLEAKDRIASEWMRACTGPNSANVWPYGSVPEADACNTEERVGAEVYDAGSLPGCTGGEPGLFDMSGNVAELTDSCEGDAGVNDACHAQGGSFAHGVDSARCEDQETFNRGTHDVRFGFRCCKDP